MKSFNLLIINLSLLGCAAGAFAQTLELETATQEALASSPVLERSKAKAEEASWARVESLQNFLPQISADANYLVDKKYMLLDVDLGTPITIPQIIPTSMITLNAMIPIFDGFRGFNRFYAAQASERAAHSESEWTRFQVASEVTLLFYKALGSQVMKEVAQQNVQTLEDHLKDVNLFKKAGVSTNYDVLRVDVQTSEARSELMNASDNVEIARARLTEALGKTEDPRSLVGKLPDPDESWIKSVDFTDTSGRKDLAALESNSDAAHRMDSAASRFWVPRVGLSAQYQIYNNRSDELFKHDDYRTGYFVGVNMSWSLFDGMASIARAHEAGEKRIQVEKTLEIARIRLKHDLDMWRRKFLYQCSVFRSRQSDVAKATESVRLAKSGHKAGTRTNTELLDAETELFRSKAGIVNAQIGALEALTNLELALGRKIP